MPISEKRNWKQKTFWDWKLHPVFMASHLLLLSSKVCTLLIDRTQLQPRSATNDLCLHGPILSLSSHTVLTCQTVCLFDGWIDANIYSRYRYIPVTMPPTCLLEILDDAQAYGNWAPISNEREGSHCVCALFSNVIITDCGFTNSNRWLSKTD